MVIVLNVVALLSFAALSSQSPVSHDVLEAEGAAAEFQLRADEPRVQDECGH